MPTYRRTLTNREQLEHESQLCWLVQAGLDVETSRLGAERSAIDICIGYTENFLNMIFEHTIWLVLITGVRLVAREHGIRLAHALFVTFPWGEDVDFDFLPIEKTGEYRIGRQHFEESLVINHQLPIDRPLIVGKPIEGLLIAQACGAKLPTSYKPGDPVRVGVSFADTLDRFYSAEGQLTVSQSFHVGSKARPRRHSSLFDDDMRGSPSTKLSARSFSTPKPQKWNSDQAVIGGTHLSEE